MEAMLYQREHDDSEQLLKHIFYGCQQSELQTKYILNKNNILDVLFMVID